MSLWEVVYVKQAAIHRMHYMGAQRIHSDLGQSFLHMFVKLCHYVQYIYTTPHLHILVMLLILVYCFAMIMQS